MAHERIEPGDEVTWKSSQGTVRGKVVKRLTSPTEIKGHHVAASPDHPEFLVESAKTGAQAAHRPDALHRAGSAHAADASSADEEAIATFHELVNMSPASLERWLASDPSREVGQKPAKGGESTGHRSGRHIVDLLRTKRADLDADDVAEMRRVAGFIKRHLAQRPEGEIEHTRWASSLKNWGHDPTRG